MPVFTITKLGKNAVHAPFKRILEVHNLPTYKFVKFLVAFLKKVCIIMC